MGPNPSGKTTLLNCLSGLDKIDEDLPALGVHIEYTLRLRRRMRSTNLLERWFEEVKRRTKVIRGDPPVPGETSCLSLVLGSTRPVYRLRSRARLTGYRPRAWCTRRRSPTPFLERRGLRGSR